MSFERDDRWKLIQQIALLAYVHKGEDSKVFYEAVLAAKVINGMWKELVRSDSVEDYRNEAILAVAKFVQAHPHATEKQIRDEVERQIAIFMSKIK